MSQVDRGNGWDATIRFRWLLRASWAVPSLAVLLIALYSCQYSWPRAFSIVSISLLVALAATAAGLLMGFLFGVPRALQQQSPTAPDIAVSYAVNTNLEQISDWLTKILVGVGLIQIGHLSNLFGDLTDSLGQTVGSRPIGPLLIGTDIIFFATWGFLLGYLLTRTYLTAAFRAFDVDEIATRAAQEAAAEVSESAEARQKEQDQIDARALSMASALLTPGKTSEDHPEPRMLQDFQQALSQASPPILEQIYQLARSQRRDYWTWRDFESDAEDARKRHERTVPVFEALTKVSPDDYRYRGDLAFSLKDKGNPDYGEAINQLNIAARLAEKAGDRRLLAWYAINRAVARIAHGNQMRRTPPWPEAAEIIADLELAEAFGGAAARIASEDMIQVWREQHRQYQNKYRD